MRVYVWGLLLMLTMLPAGAEEDWISVRADENRFVVNALNTAVAQDVALWMEQTRKRLEREFGVHAGFDPFHPLVVILHPDLEETGLRQQGRGRRIAQEIRAPEGAGFDGLLFAEAVLEAILTRFMDQRGVVGQEMQEVPVWLLRGLAPVFVPEVLGTLRAEGLGRWQHGRLNPPYTLTGLIGEVQGRDALVDMVWAVDFLFGAVGGQEVIWREILQTGDLSAEWWRGALEVGTLRDVHLAWEVWMAGRARRFLADPYGGGLFREQITRELIFSPASFGLDGDLPRYDRFSLPDLAENLDEHWVPRLVESWRRRMSMLRFSQRAERLQKMDLYIQSAEALLEAGRLRGSRRDEALKHFRRLYEAAEEL